jgi:hypothetical protein
MLNHLCSYLRTEFDFNNMNFRKYIFASFLFSLAGGPLLGQKLSVETVLDTNTIKLGDQIHLNYFIEKKRDIITTLPTFPDTLVKGIEVIGEPQIDSSKLENDLSKISISLVITSFDTGMYYIPPQPIVYSDKGLTDTLYSRASYLMVQGVALDTTNTVRDIKGPATIPITLGEILLYLIPLLVVAALIYLVIIYYRKKKANEPLFKPLKPEEPPYITALRELDKIKVQKLWQQKQVKEYYTRITYVIRWYIEKRFSIAALELISDEILAHIQSEKIDNINYSNLEKLLNLADLVKFAREEPDPEANITHLDNAYDFIKKSKGENPETQIETDKVEQKK